MDYNTLPSPELVNTTKSALSANGFVVHEAQDREEAKSILKSILTEGSSVMTMSSETLNETGISQLIEESSDYTSIRKQLNDNPNEKEKKNLAYSSDFSIGSVNAVTSTGSLIIASNTGSQQGAYAYGSGKVVFVIGTQKIVEGALEDGLKRIYDYVLPLESVRVQKAYGMPHSNVSKLLIIDREIVPERIHIILVNEVLGF